MKHLNLQDLEQRWSRIERAADATPGVDPWCSGLDWSLSVAHGFARRGKRLLLESEHGAGFVLLGYYLDVERNMFLSGLEPLWGFGSPVIGTDIAGLVDELVDELQQLPEWTALVLPGLPELPSPTTIDMMTGLSTLGPVHLGEGITRQVADLSRGHEQWLAARSSRFRRNLRRAERLATERKVTIVNVRHEADLFDRIEAIERQSWKGHEDSGVTSEEMNRMYRHMVKRLQVRGRLHAHVATIRTDNGERDVGYILGGIRNRRYRGLQISYVDGYEDLSIGNLLQHHQIQLLCQSDLADSYDMGMDIEYKRRWADRAETSVMAIVQRSEQPATERVAPGPDEGG